jgi:hypothetical protein
VSIAYHEAGHVVVGRQLGLRLLDADIHPDDEGGRGHTNFAHPGPWFTPERGRLTEDELDFIERVLTTFMAGYAAESRAGHDDPEGSGWDRDASIREWARYLEQPALDRFLERARDLVARPESWSAIETVAAALREKGRLVEADVDQILRTYTATG